MLYPAGMPSRQFLVHEFGMRASLAVGLRKDEELIGGFSIYRTIPGHSASDKSRSWKILPPRL